MYEYLLMSLSLTRKECIDYLLLYINKLNNKTFIEQVLICKMYKKFYNEQKKKRNAEEGVFCIFLLQ